MRFSEQRVRGILHSMIDEDPLACRGVLGLCAVEFTDRVPTACVTLGERSTLYINLGFLDKHCTHEDDVRFILLHEFLHVLLRHTRRFTRMTPRLNLALDLVINTTLCRMYPTKQTGFVRRYYQDAPGLARLLGPPEDLRSCFDGDRGGPLLGKQGEHTAHFGYVHCRLYMRFLYTYDLDDVLALLAAEATAMAGVPAEFLLGDHSDHEDVMVPPGIMRHLEEHALPALDRAQGRRDQRMDAAAGRLWRTDLRKLLYRLLVPDPTRAALPSERMQEVVLPVLSPSDRRAVLRSTWSPFLPASRHSTSTQRPQGTVCVYLDVSGSMDVLLPHMLAVLAEYRQYLSLPLYAFSTEVVPATFHKGKLSAQSTGGTALRCVYEHLAKTGATKALVITDGYVEQRLGPPPCILEALIPHDGYEQHLKAAGIPVTRLPRNN
jgi:hypothetical protein